MENKCNRANDFFSPKILQQNPTTWLQTGNFRNLQPHANLMQMKNLIGSIISMFGVLTFVTHTILLVFAHFPILAAPHAYFNNALR